MSVTITEKLLRLLQRAHRENPNSIIGIVDMNDPYQRRQLELHDPRASEEAVARPNETPIFIVQLTEEIRRHFCGPLNGVPLGHFIVAEMHDKKGDDIPYHYVPEG